MRVLPAFATIAMLFGIPAHADPLPHYATPGVENTATSTFTAAADGNVVAYYANSVGAAFTDTLGMLVNGVDAGILGLDNHSSALGQTLDFGSVAAGDVLTFYIKVEPNSSSLPAEMLFYSDPDRNFDGDIHVFSTTYAGGVVQGKTLPSGRFVAFEDLPHQGLFPPYKSDYNYTDTSFIFTNVAAGVPEPAAWVMMIAGVGAVGVAMRRRERRLTPRFV